MVSESPWRMLSACLLVEIIKRESKPQVRIFSKVKTAICCYRRVCCALGQLKTVKQEHKNTRQWQPTPRQMSPLPLCCDDLGKVIWLLTQPPCLKVERLGKDRPTHTVHCALCALCFCPAESTMNISHGLGPLLPGDTAPILSIS